MRDDGGRDLSITCDDFGKALKGLGFTDTVRGGKLDIHGGSDPNDPRAIVGKADIGSFNVKDLPVLAVLMNAASPFGFAGLFSGSMDFDHIRGKFRWDDNIIKLTSVHAAGAAVGINVNGRVEYGYDRGEPPRHHGAVQRREQHHRFDPADRRPFHRRRGSGFFAVDYSHQGVDGQAGHQRQSRLLLTPGFLRNLFFGGDDDEPAESKSLETH